MKKLFLLSSLTLLLFSCSDDNDDTTPTTANLEINLSGLQDLGANYVYEGWIIVDGAPVTTGVFTVNSDKVLSKTNFTVDAIELAKATAFVLSVEPKNDTDPAPSETKLLSGAFDATTAMVSVNDQVGDFTNAAGTFFLRTPTDEADGMNNGNDENGIWFGTPGAPPVPNFKLPSLNNGWRYEGWVVVNGVPITTGQFADASAQMADLAGLFSGPNPGPPVPGEDFFKNAPTGVTFPLDVRGKTVVISVEPYPDNSPKPFLLKPLVGTSGQETAPATHNLAPNLASLPTGWAKR